MKKIKPIKITWYDWLIDYIPKHITKRGRGFKDKIVCRFVINTPKQTLYGREKKLSKPKSQNIRNCFILKKNNNNKKKIKERIIRDIWILIETEEE